MLPALCLRYSDEHQRAEVPCPGPTAKAIVASATLKYEIVVSPEAQRDLKRLDARRRSEVKDGIERHLRHSPTRVSRSRSKRLRGLRQPQYRLRVQDVRVYYDVAGGHVQILGVVAKSDSYRWLEEIGVTDEDGTTQ